MQVIDGDYPGANWFPSEEVLLEHLLEALGGEIPIPDPFRIYDEPGSAYADPEASRLRPHRAEARLPNPPFHVIPESLALSCPATVRPDAEEEVPLRSRDRRLV